MKFKDKYLGLCFIKGWQQCFICHEKGQNIYVVSHDVLYGMPKLSQVTWSQGERTKRVLCLMTSQGQFVGRNSTTGFSESSTSQAVITIKITWGAFVTYTYQGPTQDLLNKNICARPQLGTLKKLPRIVLLAAINQIVCPLIENLSSQKIGGQYSLFSRAQIIQANYLFIKFYFLISLRTGWSYRIIE